MNSHELIRTLQFGAGAGAGGIFLGSPDDGNNDMGTSTNDNNEEDDRSTTDVIKAVGIILSIGVGLILGLVFSTYGLALISDKLCCCFPWFRPVSTLSEFQENFDRGPVARKARLWGLSLKERQQVLSTFFNKRAFIYYTKNPTEKQNQGDEPNTKGGESENESTADAVKRDDFILDKPQQKVHDGEHETDVVAMGHAPHGLNEDKIKEDILDDEAQEIMIPGDERKEKYDDTRADRTNSVEGDSPVDEIIYNDNEVDNEMRKGKTKERKTKERGDEQQGDETGENDKEESKNNDNEEVLDDADHERICCICLNEYEQQDKLITGTQCNHKFHFACCMEWMCKHDHCPYCRQEMITALQMRVAAIETLGEERVRELGAQPLPNTQTAIIELPSAADGGATERDQVQNAGEAGEESGEPGDDDDGATDEEPFVQSVGDGDIETGKMPSAEPVHNVNEAAEQHDSRAEDAVVAGKVETS